jgi:steroid delta-isomerase-like uncharacterized protein
VIRIERVSRERGGASVSAEENKRISRRLAEEGFAQGNVDVIDEVVAENFVNHDPGAPPDLPPGREGVKVLATLYRSAFPDTQFTIEDIVAEGDKVVTRWKARGTHQGDFAGLPATGKQATVTGITIDRVEGGKIVESWNEYNQLGLLQQLGVVPEQAATQA